MEGNIVEAAEVLANSIEWVAALLLVGLIFNGISRK